MLDTVTGNLAVNSVFITIRSVSDTKKYHFFIFSELFLYNYCFLHHGDQKFSQLRDVIHRNLAYLEGHESPLNTTGGTQQGWLELSGGDFFWTTPPSLLPTSKSILFKRCWIFHLKRLASNIYKLKSRPLSSIFFFFFFSFLFLCVCLPFANHEQTVCPRFRHQEQEKRWERDCERKKLASSTTAFLCRPNAISVCGPKAIFTLSFLLTVPVTHALVKRRSNELKITRLRWEIW